MRFLKRLAAIVIFSACWAICGLLVVLWALSYFHPNQSLEWDNENTTSVLAESGGKWSLSRWPISSGESDRILKLMDELQMTNGGGSPPPTIFLAGDLQRPKNSLQLLGGAFLCWHDRDQVAWILMVPGWMPVFLWLLAVFSVYVGYRYQRRGFKQGTCVKCGYDLRATVSKCPECGTCVGSPIVGSTVAKKRMALISLFVLTAFAVVGIFVVREQFKVARVPAPPNYNPPQSSAPSDFVDKDHKITELLKSAATSKPSAADAAELLAEVAHDPSFEIRTRAMAVLPFIRDREKAIDALIYCVHDRDSQHDGEGLVPMYATTYLADMGACRAIPDVTDWVNYLQKERPYGKGLREIMVRKGISDLARLRAAYAASTSQPSIK